MLVVMGLHPVLAKATVLQEIDIPGYTRADGTYVPPHRQHVHINPDVDQHAVLNGGGSHSQRLALRRLQKKSGWADLTPDHQYAHVLRHATELQQRASLAAKQSRAKKVAAKTASAPAPGAPAPTPTPTPTPAAPPPAPAPAVMPDAVAKVVAANQPPPALPLSADEIEHIKAYLAQVEVPDGLAKLSDSATNQGSKRRVAQLQKLAAAGDLDGITNFATSRTRNNYALVDDYKHDLLLAAHAAREAVLTAQQAPTKPPATLPAPPDITGANMKNTALLAARRKVKALHEAAHGPDPIAAVMAIPTSRGNGYQNKADDYKFTLLSHLGAGVKPAAAPATSPTKATAKAAAAPAKAAPSPTPTKATPAPAQASTAPAAPSAAQAPAAAAMKQARQAATSHLDKLAAAEALLKPKNKPGHNVTDFSCSEAEIKADAKTWKVSPAELKNLIVGMIADVGNGEKFEVEHSQFEEEPENSFQTFYGSKETVIKHLIYKSEKTGKHFAFLDYYKAGQQGAGGAKAFFRAALGMYKKLGIDHVSLHANIDVGGYAWAKFGFKPNQATWDYKRKQMLKIVPKLKYSAAALEKLTQILKDPDPRAIFVLSDLKDGEKSIGKHMLLNSDWMGELDLNDETSYRRLLGYIAQ